jgi:hypothetical protein
MAGETEAVELPINNTILSLVLIFIPGIVCYGIIAALAEKKKRDNVTIFLQMFAYGITSYFWVDVVHRLIPRLFPAIDSMSLLNPSQIGRSAVDPVILTWATFFGIVQGLCISLNLN